MTVKKTGRQDGKETGGQDKEETERVPAIYIYV